MKKKDIQGFTLVEVLISTVIFSILMLTVFSSFRFFADSSSIIKQELEVVKSIGSLFEIMTRDLYLLKISYPPEYVKPDFDFQPDIFRFSAEQSNISGYDFSRLKFLSLGHISFNGINRSGLTQIMYYVRPNNEQGFDLCRSDNRDINADIQESDCDPVLCKNITKFELIYIDQDQQESYFWDSESDEFNYATPLSIKVNLDFMLKKNIQKFQTSISLPVFRERQK